MYRTYLFLTLLALPITATSQDVESGIEGGRWIPSGTFAVSNFENNEIREKTYAKARHEKNRIVSFLPGMTIIYNSTPSNTRPNYVSGVTHSGIPVDVLESDLSEGIFSDRTAKDVVVHRSHGGCKNVACTGDPLEVGIGHAFSIISEDSEKIELINTNELRVVYSKSKFNELEKNGYLTRHKGRANPRWSLYDGYAEAVSTRCNGKVGADGFVLKASAKDYDSTPSKWALNDNRWSLKAIEIFDLGSVETDADDTSNVAGHLEKTIEDQNFDETALDFTVFAYRDSSWKPDYFKFAGLLQVVNCKKSPVSSKSHPTFVREAYLYFDQREGDNYVQNFPLSEILLTRQFSEPLQEKIYQYLNRSFFYSINSPTDYETVFDLLSKQIKFPTAVSNVIARLNSSCAQSDREKCRTYSKKQ